MTSAITLWLHILAATAWVGPQLYLFLTSMPVLRTIGDPQTRVAVMRVMVYRFGYLAAAAMIVLILSGVSNLFQRQADTDIDLSSFDFRYAWIFLVKMILVGLAIAFTLFHSLVIGPRLLALRETGDASPDKVAKLRILSIVLSALNLLIAIAILYLATLLATETFSLEQA